MSSKRKSDTGKPPAKRGRKKKVDEDFDSDSDSGSANGKNDGLDGTSKEMEVLIEGAEETKLPEELLHTFDREGGKLMISGMVTWELTGRRDPKGKVQAIRPNLNSFHRFTDEKVNGQFIRYHYALALGFNNIFLFCCSSIV